MPIVPIAAAGLLAIAVSSCATRQPSQPTMSSTLGTTLVQIGEVTNVRDVTTRGGPTSGVGSFVGGVLGAVAGSNIGGGYGRTAAAVGATVAGSVAGQRIESAGNTSKITELKVRFPDGDERTYNVDPQETFRVGDTVKVTTSRGVTRVTH